MRPPSAWVIAATSGEAPVPTPWASIGLLVLGIALLGLAARVDTSAGVHAGRRPAVVLFAFGLALLVASVLVGL